MRSFFQKCFLAFLFMPLVLVTLPHFAKLIMLFSFFDNVIRSLTLLFTVVSTGNFEPALKDFCCVETRAKKNSKQRLPPERKRDMIRWLTYLKHFVKILSNRYQDFNQYQSSICFRQNPTLAMMEIVSWKVGGSFLTQKQFSQSRKKYIFQTAILRVARRV